MSQNNNLKELNFNSLLLRPLEVASNLSLNPDTNELSNNLTVDGSLQSQNFLNGINGYQFTEDSFQINGGGTISGDLVVGGSITGSSLNIPDTTTVASLHIATTGNTWWGTNVATGYATAPAYILATGAAKFTSVTISGLQAGSSLDGQYLSALSVTAASIANATITGTQIASATIAAANITNNTITATQIANNTITATQIANNTITASQIANATITSAQISGTAGITGSQIASATIAAANIANNTITATQIANNTITAGQITNLTITASQIANLTITSGKVNTALMTYSHNLVFSVASDVQVNWATGTLTTSDGTAYTITAGNTGTMSAQTYIYLDTAVSVTVLQTTTTAGTAVGDGKMLLATAKNNTTEAIFTVFNGIGGTNIAGSSIVAGSITANEIAANTITASQIAATTITSTQIAADTITASQISTLNMTGKSCTFDTGTIGGMTMASTTLTATSGGNSTVLSSGSTAFSAGPTGSPTVTITQAGVLTATGAVIAGYTLSSKGSFGGDGSDGALSISSGTTTINLGNAAVVVKNYTSISITGTGVLAFSNPHANGSIIVLKSQGNVTLTSSATPMIDASALGATGGTGGADAPGGGDTAGSNGSPAYTNLMKLNFGTGSATSTSGVGGAIPTFNYKNVSQILNTYPGAFSGAGGGGGLGSNDDGSGIVNGGDGGRGGGGLIIECGDAWNFTTASGISVAGGAGTNGNLNGLTGNAGGGGGGGGGYFLGLYNTLTSNSGTITVSGGAGANGINVGGTVVGGGGGGSGENAGTNGSNGTPSGGTGGAGLSNVIENTLYA